MSWVRDRIEPWRPSNITGGAPFYPLFVLFALNAVDEFDQQAFQILIPEIRDYFRQDIGGITLVATLALFVTLLLGIPIGYYADRARRTRVAVAGASVWGAFSVITGLAPKLWVLGASRAFAGLGHVVNRPTHLSLLSDYYPVGTRPAVYGFHGAANSVGQFIGPLTAGFLALYFGWRTPFIVLAVPTFVFVLLALRLNEPVRGGQDRRAAGASEEAIATEEEAPSYAEGWRMIWQVRTLRRIFWSLPFLGAAFFGLGILLSIYYADVFGLNEAERGILAAATEPGQLLGIFAIIPFATRWTERDPGRITVFVGLALVGTTLSWVLLAVTPSFALSVVARIMLAAFIGVVAPLIRGLLSTAIPPRVRSMGFAVVPLFYIPGLTIFAVIGQLADSWGIRGAMTLMIPVLLMGALILTSSGAYLAADIRKVRTSTATMAEVRRARQEGEIKLLVVRDLEVSYDGTQVLFGVDFEVDEGEIVALLGTNGAGKTTLLKAISGLVEPDAGATVFDGRDMTYAPPNEIASRGVLQVPGGRGVFPSLTVEENLKAAGWLFRGDPKRVDEATDRVLEYFPVLRERWTTPAGNLSGGEQQMLTLGMAFISKPRLLMIDELSLGLAPTIVEQLLEIVKAIREQGTTIILVEQSVNVALTVAETAYFMEKGEIRFHGPTDELLERTDILRSVFLEGAASMMDGPSGRRPATRANGRRAERDGDVPVVLEVTELSKSYGGVKAIDEVSLALHEGEILGVIGPNGAGKTTLFDLVSGFLRPDAGRIALDGIDITDLQPDSRALLGLGRSFQDAKLFGGLTVEEAIALALERHVEVRDPLAAALLLPAVGISEGKVDERVDELIDFMGLEAFRDKFVSELSTGSRRIVDLACVVAHEPKVILFDEPSSGIAQRETEALGPLLLRIREVTGASLLVIEHDMPLVTGVADEIVALDLGRFVTRGDPDEVVHHPQVVSSYLGTSESVIARSGKAAGRKATAKTRESKTKTKPKRKTNAKRKTSAKRKTNAKRKT